MAAMDLFDSFVGSLSAKDRDVLKDVLSSWRQDLLAARSEEARLRIAEECIHEAHDRLLPVKR